MFNQPRKPKLLKIYEALSPRTYFSNQQNHTYKRLKRGFDGEVNWYQTLSIHFQHHNLILYDLDFNVRGHYLQIDSLIVTKEHAYHLEIKNYSSTFKYQQNTWQLANGLTILNPLHQLNRSKELLSILFNRLDIKLPIISYLICVNPNFKILNLPLDFPIVLPQFIQNFIQKVESEQIFPSTDIHQKLLGQIEEATIYHKPTYHFKSLRKGVFCHQCHKHMTNNSKRSFFCGTCKIKVTKHQALKKATEDFLCLFPNQSLSKALLSTWINHQIHPSTIQRFLKSNYTLMHKYRASFYMTSKKDER